MKKCTKCLKILPLISFYKRRASKDGLTPKCKDCAHKCKLNWYNNNIKQARQATKNWQKQNRKKYLQGLKLWREKQNKNPWWTHYHSVVSRCSSKSTHYFKKGIKNYLTLDNIKFLWFRDKAYLMKKASIDRKDNHGNYTFDNCRFLELKENLARRKG